MHSIYKNLSKARYEEVFTGKMLALSEGSELYRDMNGGEVWGNPLLPSSSRGHWGPPRPTDPIPPSYNLTLQHYDGGFEEMFGAFDGIKDLWGECITGKPAGPAGHQINCTGDWDIDRTRGVIYAARNATMLDKKTFCMHAFPGSASTPLIFNSLQVLRALVLSTRFLGQYHIRLRIPLRYNAVGYAFFLGSVLKYANRNPIAKLDLSLLRSVATNPSHSRPQPCTGYWFLRVRPSTRYIASTLRRSVNMILHVASPYDTTRLSVHKIHVPALTVDCCWIKMSQAGDEPRLRQRFCINPHVTAPQHYVW
jgi:hypothetical protein